MTEQTQSQQAAAAAPLMDSAAAAAANTLPSQPERSQAAPFLSFDDGPLFDAGLNEVHDDFFSSPEWNSLTDPSPALTTSMSFYNDSCDTSPLLADSHEAAADYSSLPLFGDFNHALYSSTEATSASPKRLPQNAFSRAKEISDEDTSMLLLRALSHHSNVNLKATDEAAAVLPAPVALTASPSAISSPLPLSTDFVSRPSLFGSLSSSSLVSVQDNRKTDRPATTTTHRGSKRRLETSDLLPIDAPIQSRTYKTPSATSRRDLVESSFAEEEAAIALEKNPILAKRLSNTLAARRSRHRKVEERQAMLDELEEEKANAALWKKRCLRMEEELDRARAQGFL